MPLQKVADLIAERLGKFTAITRQHELPASCSDINPPKKGTKTMLRGGKVKKVGRVFWLCRFSFL